MPEMMCRVCGDKFDNHEDTYYVLKEEQRPVPDEPESMDDWFSQNWFICWECVYTKLGLVEQAATNRVAD